MGEFFSPKKGSMHAFSPRKEDNPMGKSDSKKGTGLKLMKSETIHRMSKDDSAIGAKVPSYKQPEAQRRRSSSFGGSSSRKSKDSYWKKPQHHVWKANNVHLQHPRRRYRIHRLHQRI